MQTRPSGLALCHKMNKVYFFHLSTEETQINTNKTHTGASFSGKKWDPFIHFTKIVPFYCLGNDKELTDLYVSFTDKDDLMCYVRPMVALGLCLDFALCYMLQLGDDDAILNTRVHTHKAAGVQDFQGVLITWQDHSAVNTAYLYLLG